MQRVGPNSTPPSPNQITPRVLRSLDRCFKWRRERYPTKLINILKNSVLFSSLTTFLILRLFPRNLPR